MDKKSFEREIESLIPEMTLKEKIGQLAQIEIHRLAKGFWNKTIKGWKWMLAPVDLDEEGLENVIVNYGVGSLLAGGTTKLKDQSAKGWVELTRRIREYSGKTRFKIPVLIGIDAVHGTNFLKSATFYPHNLGMAAAWDPSLAEEYAAQTSKELEALGINWTFAPTIDVARDPRWGRTYETLGEDPCLASKIAGSLVRGFQKSGHVAACAKHFLGYSNVNNPKDRSPVDTSERVLREIHLPAFESAVESEVCSIMLSSGELNGIPCNVSKWLIKDLLRKELGFDGIVVSDWEDIARLKWFHRVGEDLNSVTGRAFNAGLDMHMATIDLDSMDRLARLVEEGNVPVDRINDAVRHVLRIKFNLGLFEPAGKSVSLSAEELIGNSESKGIAAKIAGKSLTLLKNEDNILPLSKDIRSVLIAGESARLRSVLCGGWTVNWQGASEDDLEGCVTIYEAVKEKLMRDAAIDYVDESSSAEVIVQKAAGKEVCILVLGEKAHAEGDGDSPDLSIPRKQKKLIRALGKARVPIILVGVVGRPLMISKELKAMRAVLWTFLPGSEGAGPVADVLFGDLNPSGKLPLTFPKDVCQLPLFYNSRSNSNYEPLYPFGFGLSYTVFEYSRLLMPESVRQGEDLDVSVSVKNAGGRTGEEVVQLYIQDLHASVIRPRLLLKGFQKVVLDAGEQKEVHFRLSSYDLSVLTEDLLWEMEKRKLVIRIGTESREVAII